MPTISSDRHGDDEAEQINLNDAASMTRHEELQDDENVDATSRTENPQPSEHEEEEEGVEEETEEADEFDDFDDFAEGAEEEDDAFGDFDTASGEAFDTPIPESIAETPSIKSSLHQPVSSSLFSIPDEVLGCICFVCSLTPTFVSRNSSASTDCIHDKMFMLHYRNT